MCVNACKPGSPPLGVCVCIPYLLRTMHVLRNLYIHAEYNYVVGHLARQMQKLAVRIGTDIESETQRLTNT